MKIHQFDDANRFFLKPGRNTWIDQQREAWLGRFIKACQDRTRELKREPEKYKELILNEEAMLELSKTELKQMQRKGFMV